MDRMDALLETDPDEPTQEGGEDWQPPALDVGIGDEFDAWWDEQLTYLDAYGVTVPEIKDFFGIGK